jgi:acyl-CoA hydrolase
VLIVWESLHQGDLRKWRGIAETESGASAQAFTGFFIVAGSEPPLKLQKPERAYLHSMTTTEANPPVRSVSSSQSEMTEVILPNDANTLGNLLGGRLMHFIDIVGAIAAYRHSRTHVVTAAMDHIDFIQPVHVGDLLILKSSVNRAFNTSLEVGVKVWVEDPQTGTHLHVASAYLVFVAVDEHGRRQKLPQLQPETPNEIRRYNDALLRREHREKESARRKQERHDTGLTRV